MSRVEKLSPSPKGEGRGEVLVFFSNYNWTQNPSLVLPFRGGEKLLDEEARVLKLGEDDFHAQSVGELIVLQRGVGIVVKTDSRSARLCARLDIKE
jgi:hypothetical protein